MKTDECNEKKGFFSAGPPSMQCFGENMKCCVFKFDSKY